MLREQEKVLKHLANFDDLTGFLNRRVFLEELSIQIDLKSRNDGRFYVVFLDIDDFKSFNDTMGHHIGDYILEEMSKRMKEVLHEEDIIGRLGGDEIGMIITRDMDKNELSRYICSMRDRIYKPMTIDDKELTVSVSFGIAIFPEDGVDSVEPLKRADEAMYCSKEEGKNRYTFSS